MIIPYQLLDPDTLNALIEHFVLREGTDYGLREYSLAQKTAQVRAQLDTGEAIIVYSELHESVSIQLAKSETNPASQHPD